MSYFFSFLNNFFMNAMSRRKNIQRCITCLFPKAAASKGWAGHHLMSRLCEAGKLGNKALSTSLPHFLVCWVSHNCGRPMDSIFPGYWPKSRSNSGYWEISARHNGTIGACQSYKALIYWKIIPILVPSFYPNISQFCWAFGWRILSGSKPFFLFSFSSIHK